MFIRFINVVWHCPSVHADLREIPKLETHSILFVHLERLVE